MYQGLTSFGIAVLIGIAIFGAIGVYLACRVLVETAIENAFRRKVLTSKKLIVSRKKHITPHEIVKKAMLMWDRNTPAGVLIRTAPQQDMWVVMVNVDVGPLRFRDLVFSVEQPVWLGLAPGDAVDNPHFGGLNPKVAIDSEIREWLYQTAEN